MSAILLTHDGETASIDAASDKIESHDLVVFTQDEESGARERQIGLRRSRVLRLLSFVTIEMLWLGFGLFVGLRLPAPTLPEGLLDFLKRPESHGQIYQSILTFVASLYQTFALFFPVALVGEVFASEWYRLYRMKEGRPDTMDLDSVSRLTSGKAVMVRHFCDKKRASTIFKLALVVSFILIPFRSIMVGVVSISQAYKAAGTNLSIGILPPISTFGEGIGETEKNARSLQLAARDAYVDVVNGGLLNYVSVLFTSDN